MYLLLLLLAIASKEVALAAKCDNYRRRLDRWGQQLLFLGDRSVQLPISVEEVDTVHCKRATDATENIRRIARNCLKPFPKQVIGLAIYGARQQIKRICPDVGEKEKMVKFGKCMRGHEEPAHQCVDTYIDEMDIVRDFVEKTDLLLPYACCLFYKTKQCITRAATPFCQKENIDYGMNILDEAVQDVQDLNCKYWEEGSTNCGTLAPIVVPRNKTTRSKSVILPLVDICTKLSND